MSLKPPTRERRGFLRHLHEPTKKYLEEWFDAPAHIHHFAHRMSNPPIERPQSRQEFQHLLQSLEIHEDNSVMHEKFGYGVRTADDGDHLIVAWEAHTEYYSYQIWHVIQDKSKPLNFGPITFPNYQFPLSPLGIRVNALDILIVRDSQVSKEDVRKHMSGPQIFSSRVFGPDVSVATSFTPDEHSRERYIIWSSSPDVLASQLPRLIDSLVAIENYTHLILLPYQAFGRAVDQVHEFEQRHLYQRGVITNQLDSATPQVLQRWLTVLTQDFLHVSRLAESMRYKLSASVPYDTIIRENIKGLQEQPLPWGRILSDYIFSKTTGVADGYQQLLRRIDALEHDFEATISVIRTKVELLLQDQNLALQDQNLKLLASVDKTTKSQAILQHTVEGLSVIVVAYYLSGLANYIFKALHEDGWIESGTLASGIFVPISLLLSFGLVFLGRKLINKRMFSGDEHKE